VRILADVEEAAERLEELIGLAVRGDEVLICRDEKPVAELKAIKMLSDRLDEVWDLAAKDRVNVPPGTTSNHDEFSDEHGLPR
jgi:antitoxin (DNA-binding transcriptional repressor) of toxin-antitoxin stability system